MSNPTCTSSEKIYYQYVLSIMYGLAAISIIYPIYSFICSFCKNKLITSNLLFYLGATLFVIIFLTYISSVFRDIFHCHNSIISHWFSEIKNFCYIISYLLLVIIFFIRLVYIFKPTRHRLSKCTITTFIILVSLGFTLGIINFIVYEFNQSIAAICLILGLLIYIFLLFWLNYLFVYKLYILSQIKSEKEMDIDLVNIITKNTLLSIICASQTILYQISYICWNFVDSSSIIGFIVYQFLGILDLHTNMFIVLLSYKYFTGWYYKLCSCVHNRCRLCWTSAVTENVSTAKQCGDTSTTIEV